MRLIDADALRERMYHDAFETDSDMQKWDGGCWIRYKMFENALNDAPTVDSVQVVRCKECRFRDTFNCGMQFYGYDDDMNLRKSDDWTMDDGFCYWGEKKDV